MSTSSMRPLAPVILLLFALLPTLSCSSDRALDPIVGEPATGAVVAGAVRDAGGAAVGGVTISLEAVVDGRTATVEALRARARGGDGASTMPAADAAASATLSAATRATVSDAAGRFAFPAVEPGAYVVTANDRDHLAATARIEVPRTAAETTFVQLSIVPTGTLSGNARLVGETLHGSIVVYVDGTSSVAVTEADGDWLMRGVPVGTHPLIAIHDQFQDATAQASIAAAGESVVVDTMELRRDRNLPPTLAIEPSISFPPCNGVLHWLGVTATDTDGFITRFEWDFEDDGIIDTMTTTGAIAHAFVFNEGPLRVSARDDDGAYGHLFIPITGVLEPGERFVDGSVAVSGDGSPTSPFKTIDEALASLASYAESCRPLIRVATGQYTMGPVLPFVGIIGGYDGATWKRTPGARSVILAPRSGYVFSNADDVSLLGLDFRAANLGTVKSVVAVTVDNTCDRVIFRDCRFQSANGHVGADGADGATGLAGTLGGNGGNGMSNAAAGGVGGVGGFGGGGSGGTGGEGGYAFNPGMSGGAGTVGACAPGGSGVANAANCLAQGSAGNPGTPGCDGAFGASGTALPADYDPLTYVPLASGTGGIGVTGVGGGGGGGGASGPPAAGCQPDRAGGGGGGGGPGFGGQGGLGGQAGGASVAFFAWGSPTILLTDCVFVTGNGGGGGGGGDGGSGGSGGAGGAGGAAAGTAGAGGAGASGGAGGAGGGGAGGAGGSVVAIHIASFIPPVITNPTYTMGTPGVGGPGGRAGASGPFAPGGLPGEVDLMIHRKSGATALSSRP